MTASQFRRSRVGGMDKGGAEGESVVKEDGANKAHETHEDAPVASSSEGGESVRSDGADAPDGKDAAKSAADGEDGAKAASEDDKKTESIPEGCRYRVVVLSLSCGGEIGGRAAWGSTFSPSVSREMTWTEANAYVKRGLEGVCDGNWDIDRDNHSVEWTHGDGRYDGSDMRRVRVFNVGENGDVREKRELMLEAWILPVCDDGSFGMPVTDKF